MKCQADNAFQYLSDDRKLSTALNHSENSCVTLFLWLFDMEQKKILCGGFKAKLVVTYGAVVFKCFGAGSHFLE